MEQNSTYKELQQKALTVIKAQQDLEQSEAFKTFMVEQKRVSDLMTELKAALKKEMINQSIDKIESPNGKDDWNIAITHRFKPVVVEEANIPEEYIQEKELDTSKLIVKNGTIYEKTINLDLAGNILKLGQHIEGMELKDTPAISIKVNGKAV